MSLSFIKKINFYKAAAVFRKNRFGSRRRMPGETIYRDWLLALVGSTFLAMFLIAIDLKYFIVAQKETVQLVNSKNGQKQEIFDVSILKKIVDETTKRKKELEELSKNQRVFEDPSVL